MGYDLQYLYSIINYVIPFFIQMLVPTPFIVVIKTVEDGFSRYKEIREVPAGKAGNLVYHRLDLLPTDQTCMHLKQLATMGKCKVCWIL